MVPALKAYNSRSVNHKLDGSWNRYTVFGKRNPAVRHRNYGAMASFSRFAPIQNDSVINDSVIYEASINLAKTSYPFSSCKLYAGGAKSTVYTEIYNGENLVKTDSIPAGNGMKVISTYFGEYPSDITLKFKGKDSPDIYGIDLTNGQGISVDNIAMRGSSGTIFTKMSGSLLAQMYGNMNVELFILQFGGNVMPYIENKKQAIDYGNWFYNQITHLKRLRPDATIIVIGPSDMSFKDKDKYITYPLLPSVRDALREATFKAGGAYWDMFEAMGGTNSMPSWVNADPPLAASDYTHFSPRGARVVAEMFYNALIYEYQIYRKQTYRK